jgi:hypothetical protein
MRAQFALPQLLSWTSGSLGMSILRPSTSTVDRQLTGIELWVRSPLLRFTNPILLTTTFLVHTDTLGYVRLDIRLNSPNVRLGLCPLGFPWNVRFIRARARRPHRPYRRHRPYRPPNPPILPIPPNPYRLRRRYRPTPTRSYRARRGLSGAPGHPPPSSPQRGGARGWMFPAPSGHPARGGAPRPSPWPRRVAGLEEEAERGTVPAPVKGRERVRGSIPSGFPDPAMPPEGSGRGGGARAGGTTVNLPAPPSRGAGRGMRPPPRQRRSGARRSVKPAAHPRGARADG